jgi:DNA (cytosine-5)-methyltransferase 1
MDAMDALDGGLDLDGFDVIHASPPCQAYSITRHVHSKEHPDLLQPVRDRLERWAARTGGIWVIENVPGAPLPDAVEVCGAHLRAHDPVSGQVVRLRRHRLFASNAWLMAPPCGCDRSTPVAGVYGGGGGTYDTAMKRGGGYKAKTAVASALMGIDWMGIDQLCQAIPPDYTEMIGEQIMERIGETSPVRLDDAR